LLLGIGVEVAGCSLDRRPNENTEKARTEGFFSQVCQENSRRSSRPAQNSGLAGANSGVLAAGSRTSPMPFPDLSRFLPGWRTVVPNRPRTPSRIMFPCSVIWNRKNTPLLDLPAFELDSLHSVNIPRVCRTQSLHRAIQVNEVERGRPPVSSSSLSRASCGKA